MLGRPLVEVHAVDNAADFVRVVAQGGGQAPAALVSLDLPRVRRTHGDDLDAGRKGRGVCAPVQYMQAVTGGRDVYAHASTPLEVTGFKGMVLGRGSKALGFEGVRV